MIADREAHSWEDREGAGRSAGGAETVRAVAKGEG